MMQAAASTCPKPAGRGMHSAAGASVWVPKPPVPERQATFWPTCRWVTPSPTACTTPAYSAPGTKGRGGLIWYLFCTIKRSGKFRLAALISTSTSPALGVGVGSSVQARASTPVGLVHNHACMGGSPVVKIERQMIGVHHGLVCPTGDGRRGHGTGAGGRLQSPPTLW